MSFQFMYNSNKLLVRYHYKVYLSVGKSNFIYKKPEKSVYIAAAYFRLSYQSSYGHTYVLGLDFRDTLIIENKLIFLKILKIWLESIHKQGNWTFVVQRVIWGKLQYWNWNPHWIAITDNAKSKKKIIEIGPETIKGLSI